MKHYLLFEEAGNEFVIECKDYDDAIKQAIKQARKQELGRNAKILTKTELNRYLKEKGLRMIKVKEER